MSNHDISSFAFLDIETTNLPEYNFNKVNITEIAIISCMKSDFISQPSAEILPRVKNKLVLCFNPYMIIHPTAEKISGFNNYMLEQQNSFDRNAAETILSFIKHQPPPVCLLAHNGNRFDFPILKRLIDKFELAIPDSVLCCDTLATFKDIERQIEAGQSDQKKDAVLNYLKLHDKNQGAKNNGFLNVPDESKKEANFQCVTELKHVEPKGQNALWNVLLKDQIEWKTINENTPKRRIEKLRKMSCTFKPVHTQNQVVGNGQNQTLKSKRTLFSPNKPKSFSLTSLYEKQFGRVPKISHEAENDVVSLLKIALAYGKTFVYVAEQNTVPFHSILKC